MSSIINVNGTDYNLKSMWDRSRVFQLIKDAMKDCDSSYLEVTEDFKIE